MQNYSGGDPRQSDVKRGNDAQHTDAALPVTKRGRHALPTDKALYDAAFHNDVPKLKALLERFHEDAAKRKLYALDINEEKPSLMHAAAEGGSVDVAIYLNQRDSELTQARLAESNVTPLYTAMMNNQKWFVVWLLKNDARCANESWGSQLTPLLWAIINGRVDYVKFLLRSKANVVYSPMEGYPQPLFVALSTRAYYTSYEAGLQFQKIPENSEEIAEAFIEALTTKKQLSRTSGLMDAENPELFNLFQKTKESDQLQQVFEEIFNVADQDVLMALFRLGVKHDCFFERGQCSVIEMAERCGMFEFADHYSKEKVLSGRVIECAIRRTDAFFTEVELNNEVRRVLSDNKESQVIKLWTDDDLNDKKRIIEYELGHYARFLGRSMKFLDRLKSKNEFALSEFLQSIKQLHVRFDAAIGLRKELLALVQEELEARAVVSSSDASSVQSMTPVTEFGVDEEQSEASALAPAGKPAVIFSMNKIATRTCDSSVVEEPLNGPDVASEPVSGPSSL